MQVLILKRIFEKRRFLHSFKFILLRVKIFPLAILIALNDEQNQLMNVSIPVLYE